MGYELFVGKRYLLSPRSDRSISMITWISIGGVALGVIALIVSTSVMNGFRSNLRDAVTGSRLISRSFPGMRKSEPTTPSRKKCWNIRKSLLLLPMFTNRH